MLWHPDRFAGEDDDKKEDATRRFQVISKAYNILNDPDKKQLYDSTGMPLPQLLFMQTAF